MALCNRYACASYEAGEVALRIRAPAPDGTHTGRRSEVARTLGLSHRMSMHPAVLGRLPTLCIVPPAAAKVGKHGSLCPPCRSANTTVVSEMWVRDARHLGNWQRNQPARKPANNSSGCGRVLYVSPRDTVRIIPTSPSPRG